MNDLVRVVKDGQSLAVHQTCVKAHQRAGWSIDQNPAKAAETALSKDIGTDSGDQFSDEHLRSAIEAATGERPHHRTGREKLVSMFNDLNKDA